MKGYFNIFVYRTNEEFSIFYKADESIVLENYGDVDIINLAIESGKLSKEDSYDVDHIEEISQVEYLEVAQTFRTWQKTM
jgi:hypothetical protein